MDMESKEEMVPGNERDNHQQTDAIVGAGEESTEKKIETVEATEELANTEASEKNEPELHEEESKQQENEAESSKSELTKAETQPADEHQIQEQQTIIAELEKAVRREVDARKELEDMLMRMEQHLKTEEDARKHTEQLLEDSLKNEVILKKELESVYAHQKRTDSEFTQEKNMLTTEREQFEAERQQMEMEISTAREEAQRAIDALKTAEDRVRAAERVEMTRMESEYQKRISLLGLELERVRQELVIRTKILSEEMERWRQQAEYTAAAVIEAKAEVSERKRDLDSTRDKMDQLMDRLHVGREQGLVLQASLTTANAYTSHAQRSLIQSMETNFQQNVQQALPWGGQVGEKGTVAAQNGLIVDDLAMFSRGVEVGGTAAARLVPSNRPKLLNEQRKPPVRKTKR